MRKPKPQKHSPLYTSKTVAKTKAARFQELGKDSDGAHRVTNRRDQERAE